MNIKFIFGISLLYCTCSGVKDDKKWIWDSSNRNSHSRSDTPYITNPNPKPRYDVIEEQGPADPSIFLPIYNPSIEENRPSGPPGQRPGGIYSGTQFRPTYGGQGGYAPVQGQNLGILTGPVPSWNNQSPLKQFDKCKCTEKFNCNSPGISYGHCDVGKQYCCYSTKKHHGEPLPSKPIHSIENGILAGPGGPVDYYPGLNNYPRPPNPGSGVYNSGHYYGAPNNAPEGIRDPNLYSPSNGVLAGPGAFGNGHSFGLQRSGRSNTKAEEATQ